MDLGIVSGAANAENNLRELCDDLSDALGTWVRPRIFKTFGELRQRLVDGKLAIAWSPPIAAMRLAHLARIAVGVHREGGTSYSSAIFTAASSAVTALEQLRGRRMAWVDEESAAGYVIPKKKLFAAGVTTFAAQTFEGSHEAVVRAVLEGRADGGATNVAIDPVSGRFESTGWSNVTAGDAVRVLATAGPIPPDVIVIANTIDDAMHDRITDALLAMATRAHVLSLFAGRGFVLVGRYQYEELMRA